MMIGRGKRIVRFVRIEEVLTGGLAAEYAFPTKNEQDFEIFYGINALKDTKILKDWQDIYNVEDRE